MADQQQATRKKSGAISVRIEIPEADVRRLNRLVDLLGDRQAPYLAEGLREAAAIMVREIQQRAPSVVRPTVRARPVGPRSRTATVTVGHGAAKELEYGRKYPRFVKPTRKRALWWPGAAHPIARPVRPGPFAARPFIGVMDGGHAIGAAQPQIQAVLAAAVEREFARLAGEG